MRHNMHCIVDVDVLGASRGGEVAEILRAGNLIVDLVCGHVLVLCAKGEEGRRKRGEE